MKEFTQKEIKWIKRLQKVLDAQPECVTGFCTGTKINFYKGQLPLLKGEAVDGSIYAETVRNKNWEAGAY